MLITVFVFIGIEGASVYSRFAKKRADVGKATDPGLRHRHEPDGAGHAAALCACCSAPRSPGCASRRWRRCSSRWSGHWGAIFISVGLLVSVLGAYLAWSLICAEVMFAAGKSKDMPAASRATRTPTVPVDGALADHIIVQLFVISTYWSRDAFTLMLDLTSATSLIPYLLVAAYGLMIAQRGETYERAAGRAPARPDPRRAGRRLHAVHDLRRRPEVHPAVRRSCSRRARCSTSGRGASREARSSTKTSDWVIFGVIVGGRHRRRLRPGRPAPSPSSTARN